ncbi:hypothetical protein K474DRAFT_1658540 [Panus rudis PR-1116 ss-1]|nr:hypothetical protein K474DRAFT_1658540 [Panus rudis PR-1116 ss-1]
MDDRPYQTKEPADRASEFEPEFSSCGGWVPHIRYTAWQGKHDGEQITCQRLEIIHLPLSQVDICLELDRTQIWCISAFRSFGEFVIPGCQTAEAIYGLLVDPQSFYFSSHFAAAVCCVTLGPLPPLSLFSGVHPIGPSLIYPALQSTAYNPCHTLICCERDHSVKDWDVYGLVSRTGSFARQRIGFGLVDIGPLDGRCNEA